MVGEERVGDGDGGGRDERKVNQGRKEGDKRLLVCYFTNFNKVGSNSATPRDCVC